MITFFLYLKYLLLEAKKKNDLAFFRAKWKKRNKDNLTIPGRLFPINSVTVGKHSYGTLNVVSYGSKEEKLSIGCFCSVAGSVVFLLSGEHNYNSFFTYPIGKLIVDGKVESLCKGPIVVEDDVWIGYGCIILSGVTIGKGSVIAAGSVVTKDVPPFSIWINNRVYKYRFDDNIIKMLTKINYSEINDRFIKENFSLLCAYQDDESIYELTEEIKRIKNKI